MSRSSDRLIRPRSNIQCAVPEKCDTIVNDIGAVVLHRPDVGSVDLGTPTTVDDLQTADRATLVIGAEHDTPEYPVAHDAACQLLRECEDMRSGAGWSRSLEPRSSTGAMQMEPMTFGWLKHSPEACASWLETTIAIVGQHALPRKCIALLTIGCQRQTAPPFG